MLATMLLRAASAHATGEGEAHAREERLGVGIRQGHGRVARGIEAGADVRLQHERRHAGEFQRPFLRLRVERCDEARERARLQPQHAAQQAAQVRPGWPAAGPDLDLAERKARLASGKSPLDPWDEELPPDSFLR